MTHQTIRLPIQMIATTAGLLLMPAIAFAEVAQGDMIGTTETEIRAHLTAQGYEVKEVEMEDDEIEIDVSLNGKALEIEIDPQTGKVTEVEDDDD